MTYEAFFAGVGGIVLGTLIGAWVSCRLTYCFQQRLLQQQLDFQKGLLEQQLAAGQKSHEEWLKFNLEIARLDTAGGTSLKKQLNFDLGAIEKAITSLKQ